MGLLTKGEEEDPEEREGNEDKEERKSEESEEDEDDEGQIWLNSSTWKESNYQFYLMESKSSLD